MELDFSSLLTDEILQKFKKRLRDMVRTRNCFWIRDVDDLMQDSLLDFINACNRGIFEYQDENKLLGYLTQTAIFNIYNQQRKSIKNKELNFVVDTESDLQLIDTMINQEDPYLEEKLSIHYAIKKLNCRRREVIERSIAGESISDISKAMGCSNTAVSCAKFQAIQDIKRILDNEICGN